MNPRLLKVIIPSVLAFFLLACVQQVYNVDNQPIKSSMSTYDLSDVTKAIKRAGAQLGWDMREATPGHLVGTLKLRSHVAVVDVVYTLDEFSITYKNSVNLNYDPGGNTIHRNYNGWIQNLSDAIDTQLTIL